MSTYASVCGGPYKGDIDELFFRFKEVSEPDQSQSDTFDVACVSTESSFYLWGDWDVISEFGEEFCVILSQNGKAGVFMGQDSSDYYRVTIYENGRQVSEDIFHPEEYPEGKYSSLDGLWKKQEEITEVDLESIDESTARDNPKNVVCRLTLLIRIRNLHP